VIAVVNDAEAGSERIHSSTLVEGVGRKVSDRTEPRIAMSCSFGQYAAGARSDARAARFHMIILDTNGSAQCRPSLFFDAHAGGTLSARWCCPA